MLSKTTPIALYALTAEFVQRYTCTAKVGFNAERHLLYVPVLCTSPAHTSIAFCSAGAGVGGRAVWHIYVSVHNQRTLGVSGGIRLWASSASGRGPRT